jgi:sugar lactone lactonase YvrE
MDEGGCIWVASPFPPSGFLRVAEGGQIVERIMLSDTAAFACALGGADRKTLFLLESKYPPDETQRHGRIRTVEVETAGAGFP